MKQKYTQIVRNGTISNSHLAKIEKDYKVIAAYTYDGKVYYLLKRKNILARLINKIF